MKHFHEVTKNINQEFLPVTSLEIPGSKRQTNSLPSSEPTKKKQKTMHDQVMGIGVTVVRAHHRQEKQFGFLVSA